MATKAIRARHRVTFAPDTKTETEQLDCLVRAIEPGIDELSKMIQNMHIDYTGNKNKRRSSFDSSAMIEKLRNTLDKMLDSELADSCIKNDNGYDDLSSNGSPSSGNRPLPTINESEERKYKTNHDSGVGDIGFDIEKTKKNEVSPQARKRVSKFINKLDNCITELQKVTDIIEEETATEVQALLNNEDIQSRKEALPSRNSRYSRQVVHPREEVLPTMNNRLSRHGIHPREEAIPINNNRIYRHSVAVPPRESVPPPMNGRITRHYSDDSKNNVYKNRSVNVNNLKNTMYSEPLPVSTVANSVSPVPQAISPVPQAISPVTKAVSPVANAVSPKVSPVSLAMSPNVSPKYYAPEPNNCLYRQSMKNYGGVNDKIMSKLELARKGIFTIPNQPTVMEACYSGFLLSSIFNVVTDDCSVLYFGILTGSNLYFYNSTDDNEPMFGRIIIDQNTHIVRLPNDNIGFFIEIDGIYAMPDDQIINSKVRIKFNSKHERNIWYKVIKTTVNDWKIKASYANNPVNGPGVKRRLSFLSSIQLQPYLVNKPKRIDSMNKEDQFKQFKKPNEFPEATLFTPSSADTMTNPNDLSISNINDLSTYTNSSVASKPYNINNQPKWSFYYSSYYCSYLH